MKPTDQNIPTESEIVDMIKGLSGRMKERNQALVSFLYIFGCRVSEVVGDKKYYPPIIKEQLKLLKDGENRYLVVTDVYTEKRRKKVLREIPAPIDSYPEKELIPHILRWLKFIPEQKYPIFPSRINPSMSRKTVYHITKTALNRRPHWFRHVRLTHLAKRGFSTQHLKQFTGWASSQTADSYVSLSWYDIAKAFERVKGA